MAGGGIFYAVACDACDVPAEPGRFYERRQDALRARTRIARYDGWLLRRHGMQTELLCPECCEDAKP